MHDSDSPDPAPGRSPIPGRDEPEAPRESEVLGEPAEAPEGDVTDAEEDRAESDVMGAPDETDHEIMGTRRPQADQVFDEDGGD